MSGSTVSGVDVLARRYRWLLALYPLAHRRLHGEEMLGVLLASAEDGRRLGLADAADLIGGALRIRFRSVARGSGDPRWRDALAVLGVVAPLLLLAEGLGTSDALGVAIRAARGSFEDPFWLAYSWWWPFIAGPAVLVVLVLLSLRRTAATVALVLTAAHTIMIPSPGSIGTAMWVLLGGLATVALALPPGPRRGLEILGWWRTALIGVGALVLAALLYGDPSFKGVPNGPGRIELVFKLVAVIGAACLLTPVGRRVVALLVIPAIPLFAGDLVESGVGPVWLDGPGQREALLFGSALLVLCVIAIAAQWRRHRQGTGRAGGPDIRPGDRDTPA